MEPRDQLRTGVDAVLQRRGWPQTGSAEWGFLDRSGFLVDAEAEDDPATFLAEEIRELRHEVDAMAAERAIVAGRASPGPPSTWPRGSRPSSRRRSRAGDDDRPGLWERARAAAMLFYLERTGRSADRRPAAERSGGAPSDEAAAFEIAHPVRVLGITTVGEWQATTKVTLALDPTLSAAQVAAMWQKVRSGVLRQGARGRTVSRKSLALALFVAHHPGRTWADLRRMWNQLYAHWAFKSPDLRVFRNAAVRARRYLLEPPELDDVAAGTWQWVQRRAARLASSANNN